MTIRFANYPFMLLGALALGAAVAACSGSSDGLEDFTQTDAGNADGKVTDAKTDTKSDTGTDGAGSCDPSTCATPPNGLLACCTTSDACGFKAGQSGICYSNDAGGGGTGGTGGSTP